VTQTKEDKECIVFGMYVDEFEKDCGIVRNDGRVYISYLDSTPYYKAVPENFSIFMAIINGYLRYASALGFHKAHIWSCAPNHKNPYWIFKNNSKSYRNQEALNTWYERLLKTGQWHYELIQNTQRNRPEELQVFPGDVKQIAKQAGVLTGANIFIVDLTKNCSWFNRYFEEVKLFDSSKVTERSTMLKEDFGSEISAHVATSKVLKELLANYGDSVEYNSHRICNPNWSQKD